MIGGCLFMKCKKCRKEIPDGSKFCNHCGAKQENQRMYRRPDGLYEKIITINGKRKAFRGKTEKEVTKKILEYQEDIEAGAYFNDIVDEWEEHHFKELALSTQKSYKPCENALKEYFKQVRIKSITTKDLQKFLNILPLSFTKKTIRNYRSVASSIFTYAVRLGYIDSSPLIYTKVEQGQKSVKRRATTAEENEIIINSAKIKFGLFALLLLCTGCRRAEALALKFEDIDRKNKIIHINKSVAWENSKPYLKEPKTEAGVRDVILVDLLSKYLPKNKTGLIFSGKNGLMTEKEYRCKWEAYQKATGLTITAHNIRHGFATILHEANINAKEAQGQLGHADIQTTLNIYTETTNKSRNATSLAVNNYIDTQILHSNVSTNE